MSKVSLKHGTKTLLMVEGKHEVDFFEALMKTRCIPQESFQVMDLAGKNNLAINLKTIKNDPEFHGILSLGIVRDADYLLSASPDRPPYSSTAAESATIRRGEGRPAC